LIQVCPALAGISGGVVSGVTPCDQEFSGVTAASGVFLAFLCEFAQEFAHPAGTFIDILSGHRIGDAYMLAGAESFTGTVTTCAS